MQAAQSGITSCTKKLMQLHTKGGNMKYLVISTNPLTRGKTAFFTNWFDSDKFNQEADMVVIDLTRRLVTFDGVMWQDIEEDN